MDARPILVRVAQVLRKQGLEAVMIGNAAAALHGAPVTTLDVDFFIPKTPTNVRKLKKVAGALGATAFAPFYPVSGMFRLIRDVDGLQLDFMTRIEGVSSFNSVRAKAAVVDVDGEKLLIADLADIIASKRAAGRPKDLAVLHELESTLEEQEAQRRGDPAGASERE